MCVYFPLLLTSVLSVSHTDSETNTCMYTTTMHAVADKLFRSLLFYTLPNPQSKGTECISGSGYNPFDFKTTLTPCVCVFVCITTLLGPESNIITLLPYPNKHSSLRSKSRCFCAIHKFSKLILLCSTRSQAQQF